MAFKVTEHSESNSWVESEETLWLTADKEKLVADGHPDAAYLFTTPGKRIPKDVAERYGLVKQKAKAEEKQQASAEDKQRKRGDDK